MTWHKHNTVKYCYFYTDELNNIVCAVRGTNDGWRLIYRKDGKTMHEMMMSDNMRSALIEATGQIERVRGLLKQEKLMVAQLKLLSETVGNA